MSHKGPTPSTFFRRRQGKGRLEECDALPVPAMPASGMLMEVDLGEDIYAALSSPRLGS